MTPITPTFNVSLKVFKTIYNSIRITQRNSVELENKLGLKKMLKPYEYHTVIIVCDELPDYQVKGRVSINDGNSLFLKNVKISKYQGEPKLELTPDDFSNILFECQWIVCRFTPKSVHESYFRFLMTLMKQKGDKWVAISEKEFIKKAEKQLKSKLGFSELEIVSVFSKCITSCQEALDFVTPGGHDIYDK
jgi:exopolysaccharide biosynthesis predicted pyruvyltransferase EpsI